MGLRLPASFHIPIAQEINNNLAAEFNLNNDTNESNPSILGVFQALNPPEDGWKKIIFDFTKYIKWLKELNPRARSNPHGN